MYRKKYYWNIFQTIRDFFIGVKKLESVYAIAKKLRSIIVIYSIDNHQDEWKQHTRYIDLFFSLFMKISKIKNKICYIHYTCLTAFVNSLPEMNCNYIQNKS